MRKLRRLVPLLVLMAALATASFSCRRAGSFSSAEGMVWNTTYHITFKGSPELSDSVLKVLDRVGASLNVFDSSSLVSRVNAADTTVVDSDFIRVYNSSLRINKASQGMFDPTLSPLITAWGFGKGHTLTADTAAVDSVLDFVGIRKTSLENGRIIKSDRRIQFNFSAIAKGYGCDMVAEMFRRNGVTDYLVEIGGEIAVGGDGPGGSGWRISIDRPVESDSVIHDSGAVVVISDCGIATSGNYRNFRKEGGKTLGHTISPVTGRPTTTDVISATVVAPTCMEADGAATACMAAGSEISRRMIEELGFDAMLVLADSTVWTTPGFSALISAASEPGNKGRN